MELQKFNAFLEDEIQTLLDGLNAYNYNKVKRDYLPFMIVIKENDLTIAGAQCASTWKWMNIKLLWVEESHSRKGLGRKIMLEIEEEARKRGCLGVHVDTFEFQALEFYQKLGYSIFGEIEDHPPGHRRFYLKKRV